MGIISINTIKALELARKEIAELREYERNATRSMVSCEMNIREVYSTYLNVAKEYGLSDKMMLRKKFIFIAAWLYAPGVLAGDRMPRGLRQDLMSIFEINAPTAISNNFAEIFFYFRNHKSTQRELTTIANETLRRISA